MRLLTAKQVAAMLGLPSKSTYELGIPYVRLSERRIRWREEDVIRWIETRTLKEAA